MPRIILLVISLIALACTAQGQSKVTPTFRGTAKTVITSTPDKTSGLDAIYVCYNAADVTAIAVKSSQPEQVKWQRYSTMGGGYAEPLTSTTEPGYSVITAPQPEMGYIVETPQGTTYFWLTDYKRHRMTLNGLYIDPEQECFATGLTANGQADAIHYTGINGRQFTLDRDIRLTYQNLEWSDDDGAFKLTDKTDVLTDLSTSIQVTPAVTCITQFEITGDKFLTQWGEPLSAQTVSFHPTAVDCHTTAEQITDPDSKSNQMGGAETDGLGGSAPADITFYAVGTDAVIHNEWQLSQDPEFEFIDYRFNEQDLTYTFRDEGVFYVRYVGSNADGSCETYGDTYTVSIGASDIKCPNAFSPGASEGVNDEWKVSYRSIIKFDCHIFNRYGVQMCHLTDPSQGWDGRYRGKLVKAGVYYYVIDAEGADGKRYKLSGDINILNYRGGASSGSSADDTTSESTAE